MRGAFRESETCHPTDPYRRHTMRPYPRPSGSAFGYFLVVLLSLIYVGLTANGMRLLSGVPYFVCLIFNGVLYAMKLYFLRRQPPHELFVNSGWDKVFGYLATSIVSVPMAAYGLYGMSDEISKASVMPISVVYQRQNGTDQLLNKFRLPVERREIRIQESRVDLDQFPEHQQASARELKGANFETPGINWRIQNYNSSGTQQLPETSFADEHLKEFVKATLAQQTNAISCWIVAIIIEALLLILVVQHRPRYLYWE